MEMPRNKQVISCLPASKYGKYDSTAAQCSILYGGQKAVTQATGCSPLIPLCSQTYGIVPHTFRSFSYEYILFRTLCL